jgi:hypothetical protein
LPVWPTSHVGMLHPAGGAKARARSDDFVKFCRAALDGKTYVQSKSLFAESDNQVETRKSLFEEFGLLFVPRGSNAIHVTPVGKQLFELVEGSGGAVTPELSDRATALLTWALANSQVDRPQSFGTPPLTDADRKACKVRPYALVWRAIEDLGGVLHLHEFMGVLRHVFDPADYAQAISAIQSARKAGKILATAAAISGRAEMNYRIYWKSHLSLADKLLGWDANAFHVNPSAWAISQAVLALSNGCGSTDLDLIASRQWNSTEDYFLNVAGVACPPFIATGKPIVSDFDGQQIADLRKYQLSHNGPLTLVGGPELCSLPLKAPCFHDGFPSRLLRLDKKSVGKEGTVTLVFGAGRPIIDLQKMLQVFGESK